MSLTFIAFLHGLQPAGTVSAAAWPPTEASDVGRTDRDVTMPIRGCSGRWRVAAQANWRCAWAGFQREGFFLRRSKASRSASSW